jgi:hypothetical protein
MDNYDPNWVWYASGIIMLLSAITFAGLHLKAGERFASVNGDTATPSQEVVSS